MNKSKATYSWDFLKREIIIGIVVIAVVVLLAFFLFPEPANSIFAGIIVVLGILFLVASLLIKKFIYGVVTEIQGNNLKIYKSDSFLLKPAENELLLVYGKYLHGACLINRDNIKSVRKVNNSEEIDAFKSLFNQRVNLRVLVVNILVNFETIKKLIFVTDYTNIVEIELNRLKVNYNGINEIATPKLYVSVKDPNVVLSFAKRV